MNYLLDKKAKRNKYLYIFFLLIILVALVYFRASVLSGLSYASSVVFNPIISSGNGLVGKFRELGTYFSSKDFLSRENEALKLKLSEDKANRANYDSVVAENSELKDILGRKGEQMSLILGSILAKPNKSIYDTIVIDIGENKGVKSGNRVFAFGNVPIGHVAEVYSNSSKVVLFSNSGEKTEVLISSNNISLEMVGRGGGNFEMALPRDLTILKGDQAVLTGITPYVVGVVETVISDPRDSFQKALLVSPVNIQQLKFVQVEIN